MALLDNIHVAAYQKIQLVYTCSCTSAAMATQVSSLAIKERLYNECINTES